MFLLSLYRTLKIKEVVALENRPGILDHAVYKLIDSFLCLCMVSYVLLLPN